MEGQALKLWLDSKKAAEYLGISITQLRRLKLPCTPFSGAKKMWLMKDLENEKARRGK